MICVFWFGTMHADWVQNKTHATSTTSRWITVYAQALTPMHGKFWSPSKRALACPDSVKFQFIGLVTAKARLGKRPLHLRTLKWFRAQSQSSQRSKKILIPWLISVDATWLQHKHVCILCKPYEKADDVVQDNTSSVEGHEAVEAVGHKRSSKPPRHS